MSAHVGITVDSPTCAASMARRAARAGVLYGVGAYGLWGLFPLYFKLLSHVRPRELLTHRIIWSFVFLVGLMAVRRGFPAVRATLRDRRTTFTLLGTTWLIACNWYLFIWSIDTHQLLQSSLGYFINPLVNVLLGAVFLRERLRRFQAVAVLLAAAGVTYLTISYGQVPKLALVLAVSFGLYGLLRKTARVDAAVGLTVETALLTPLAAAYLVWLLVQHEAAFGAVSWRTNLLLLAAGVITALPLVWFTEAAQRLRLTTLGFLQYLSPTGQFLLAVLAFGEPFTRAHAIGFACIWTALLLYSLDAALSARPQPVAESPE